MSFSGILYSILIKPIETLFDIIFYRSFYYFSNVGLSIIILSLVVNLLALPLYNKADKMQAEEAIKKQKLKKWEKHIKNSFKGNERFMVLQTYYRQNDYKPYQTLKSAMPLLLEIPFFIAAYHFLSNLPMLTGVSFGPLKNLGTPDGLIKISGITINVLPILMTLLNIVSGTVYNRTTSFKEKLQTYIIALVFLYLLYKSPSGLVFYWTLNNLFSLIKNIVYRLISQGKKKPQVKKENSKFGFFVSNLFLALLIGLYIPTTVMKSSVQEFVDISALKNPLVYLVSSFCLAIGFFVVWLGVYYFLLGEKAKTIIGASAASFALIAIFEYIALPDDFELTNNLTYLNAPVFSKLQHFQGVIIFIAVAVVCTYMYKKNKGIIISVITAGVLVISFLCIKNTLSINSEYKRKTATLTKYDDYPEIHLSKNGKNVMVFMMDRMVSYYIPYIFAEFPGLSDCFDGFTYYPNSVSYGTATNSGSPALFGGYDYIPLRMNERTDMRLVDKQNEALKVMPVLFSEQGYDVTVCDPTYAGYDWIPDLSIYDDYQNIHKYITNGRMTSKNIKINENKYLDRNFFFYGLLRVSPTITRDYIYNYGNYNSAIISSDDKVGIQLIYDYSKAKGFSEEFIDAYSVLNGLPEITKIDDTENGSFMMLSNDTTHSDCLLQEPYYTPAINVDNTEYDAVNNTRTDWNGNTIKLFEDGFDVLKQDGTTTDGVAVRILHYHINACALLKLGEYMDYLKEKGVYNNTKVIIVSDHSAPLGLDYGLVCNVTFEDGSQSMQDLLAFQSTLLVKDFNSSGFCIDNQFMTNADVPSIATEGIIDNAVNPFTGNSIKSNEKNDYPIYMMATEEVQTTENNGNRFVPTYWFSVHDNIFDGNNWSYEGYY